MAFQHAAECVLSLNWDGLELIPFRHVDRQPEGHEIYVQVHCERFCVLEMRIYASEDCIRVVSDKHSAVNYLFTEESLRRPNRFSGVLRHYCDEIVKKYTSLKAFLIYQHNTCIDCIKVSSEDSLAIITLSLDGYDVEFFNKLTGYNVSTSGCKVDTPEELARLPAMKPFIKSTVRQWAEWLFGGSE